MIIEQAQRAETAVTQMLAADREPRPTRRIRPRPDRGTETATGTAHRATVQPHVNVRLRS